MKKTLILLLLSFNTFAQVFDLDTTFRFENVKKKYNVTAVYITTLREGTLLFNSTANVINDELKVSTRFLLNKDADILATTNPKSKLNYSNTTESNVITFDNKLIVNDYSSYPLQKLVKYYPDGEVDSTFKFPVAEVSIFKTHLLKNNELLVNFVKPNSDFYYHIFDNNGKFIKDFDLSKYGYSTKSRLNKLVFNNADAYFLLISTELGHNEIIKVNTDFELDNSFVKKKYSLEDAYSVKLHLNKGNLVLYRNLFNKDQTIIETFDFNGKIVSNTRYTHEIAPEFSSSSTQIFYQQDGITDFITYYGRHLRLRTNGEIDSVFYENNKSKKIRFLHAFEDGTYWIMRNDGGVIEKMYPDGNIDTSFKIKIQQEKTMYPTNIQKIGDINYVVNFTDLEYYSPPTVVRNSSNPNCIRIYNSKHQLIHDFFDAKTTWRMDIISNSILIRDKLNIIKIDSILRITSSLDTLSPNDFIDLKNNDIYRITKGLGSQTIIRRFRLEGGLDENFVINSDKIVALKILNDGRIAVKRDLSSGYSDYNILFEIYKADGQKDISVKQINVSSDLFYDRYLYAEDLTINYDDGFIITLTSFSGLGSIFRGFVKFDKYGNFDTNFQRKLIIGGQFLKYSNDGSVYSNSADLLGNTNVRFTTYNFLKILPNGKIDSTFNLNGSDIIYGFDFFDANTIYASNGKTIIRFIKNPSKKSDYFYFEPLPTKVTWNYASSLKVNIKTTLKNLKIVIRGDAFLKDSLIYITSKVKGGSISVEVTDSNNRRIAFQNISIIGVIPSFIYDEPKLTIGSPPYTFSVKATSNLPVKVYVNGSKYENEAILFSNRGTYFEIKLVSEGNNQYETIEKTFILSISEPLANEPSESIKFYPNPVRDILTIENQNQNIQSIKLFNVNGKVAPFSIVEASDKLQINLKHLPAGMYFLQLSNSQKQFFQKIWVE